MSTTKEETRAPHDHFQGKSATEHIQEKREGEVHGMEIPGHLGKGFEASKDTAALLSFLGLIMAELSVQTLFLFAFAWVLWKSCKSAWKSWSRLERLQRVVEEERWEIRNNREQEREELRVLYSQKGFKGKLLEEVCDVLMADEKKLLKVMLEEEMGLELEVIEHPLKQALGAFIGAFSAALCCLLAFYTFGFTGLLASSYIVIIGTSMLKSAYQRNDLIRAFTWNLSITSLCFGMAYYLKELIL